ncbi:MAG TPA: FecR family protein [Polyangiales bacterium]|nr:FecR family protein [Polyangiales bacterium]
MPEPTRDLEKALTRIDERWNEARTERTLSGLHLKRERRRTRQRVLVAAAGACGIAALVFWQLRPQPTLQPSAAATQALHMQLSDGSQVELHDAQARVELSRASDAAVELEMPAGRARFDVVHREQRVFQVRCGEVVVKVLGTAFELEREGARTRVAVSRGRVLVTWNTGSTELAAGEAGWFPRAPEPARNVAAIDAGSPSVPRSAKRPSHKPPAATAWREPAEQGDFERAYELLARAPQPIADDVEELLLAADTARLSGHPEAALPYLKRVIAQHAKDSRAPLAAFTLGGVLMHQLGQPREAEAAYARARELSLNPSLSEDALARQVEAAYRASDSARARSLAQEYLADYPNGRRVRAVRRFGGL